MCFTQLCASPIIYLISGRTRKQRRMWWKFNKILFGLLPNPHLFSWKFFFFFFWLYLNDRCKLVYGFEPLSHLPNFFNIFPLPSSTSQPDTYLTKLYISSSTKENSISFFFFLWAWLGLLTKMRNLLGKNLFLWV